VAALPVRPLGPLEIPQARRPVQGGGQGGIVAQEAGRRLGGTRPGPGGQPQPGRPGRGAGLCRGGARRRETVPSNSRGPNLRVQADLSGEELLPVGLGLEVEPDSEVRSASQLPPAELLEALALKVRERGRHGGSLGGCSLGDFVGEDVHAQGLTVVEAGVGLEGEAGSRPLRRECWALSRGGCRPSWGGHAARLSCRRTQSRLRAPSPRQALKGSPAPAVADRGGGSARARTGVR